MHRTVLYLDGKLALIDYGQVKRLTEEERQNLHKRSPLRFLEEVQGDVLMLLGDSDRRVPMAATACRTSTR